MIRIVLFIGVLGILSCNGGCNSGGSIDYSNVTHENFVPPKPKETYGQNVNIDELVASRGGRIIQYACSLVSTNVVAEALGMNNDQIKQSNATPAAENPVQSACFYKWEDFDLPNSGIFIQIIRNPLGDEYPDYISKYVESYRLQGEQGVDEQPVFFKKFEGFGDDGSYSTEAGKYFWRLGEKVSFLVAFNTTHNPAKQYEIATAVAKELTLNYLK